MWPVERRSPGALRKTSENNIFKPNKPEKPTTSGAKSQWPSRSNAFTIARFLVPGVRQTNRQNCQSINDVATGKIGGTSPTLPKERFWDSSKSNEKSVTDWYHSVLLTLDKPAHVRLVFLYIYMDMTTTMPSVSYTHLTLPTKRIV